MAFQMPDARLSAAAAWGAQLRAARLRRRRLVRRGIALAGLVAAVAGTTLAPPAPRLVWNMSASAPLGLYAVNVGARVISGDMVVARIPARWRRLADVRHYLPANIPAVKRVAATAGDEVCAQGRTIRVDGRPIAHGLAVDGAGRPLPLWAGCTMLGRDELFLIMDAPTSFDGRYFGISKRADVLGKAIPLWTWVAPSRVTRGRAVLR
jgi:conjugative transfer signal peptidase TraF